MLKKTLVVLFSLFMCLSFTSYAWAVIPIQFTHSGNGYIFSDNPEDIPSTNGWTIGSSLASGSTYDVELYHHNYTGSTKKIGAALQNTSSSSATITVYAKVIGYSNTDQGSEVDLTAVKLRDYQNGSGSTTITIPANSCAWLMYSDVPTSKLVYGKAKIKSNRSGVYVRVFHGPTNATSSQVFTYSRDSASGSATTSGCFEHDGKNHSSSIDASTYPTFYLSEWRPNYNINEYENAATGYLGNQLLAGNYGMTYNITITNPGGKRIRITPNWVSGNNYARIVLYTPSNGWYTTTKIPSSQSWIMATGTGSTFSFKYALPGGNFGNMKFEIIN